jgi:hypothetical protein
VTAEYEAMHRPNNEIRKCKARSGLNTSSIAPINLEMKMKWNQIGTSNDQVFYFLFYCIFKIYSRYIKRVISKRDGCEYLKQVPSIDGSLELV